MESEWGRFDLYPISAVVPISQPVYEKYSRMEVIQEAEKLFLLASFCQQLRNNWLKFQLPYHHIVKRHLPQKAIPSI